MNLPEWKGDKLHIDSDIGKLDGHQRTYNLIVTEREAGKSTLLWKKVYNNFKRKGHPSIIFRRYAADFNDDYIKGIQDTIFQFTGLEINFEYKKSQFTGGITSLYVEGQLFCQLISLNVDVSRLKLMRTNNVNYFMYDEFICNKRLGEKYLIDEPFKIKELYTTLIRYTDKIKIYFFGNPYSLYNPFFSDLKVNTNDLYPGAFVVKNDYAIWCYQIKPELKEKILQKNPLYKFDNAYKEYAFDGRAIQDKDIRIEQIQPNNFSLSYVFKLKGKYIGVFRGFIMRPEPLFYWCKILEPKEISSKRDIICFDFGEMVNRTVLYNNKGRLLYQSFKEAIERRYVAYASTEESWLIEEIYQEL